MAGGKSKFSKIFGFLINSPTKALHDRTHVGIFRTTIVILEGAIPVRLRVLFNFFSNFMDFLKKCS